MFHKCVVHLHLLVWLRSAHTLSWFFHWDFTFFLSSEFYPFITKMTLNFHTSKTSPQVYYIFIQLHLSMNPHKIHGVLQEPQFPHVDSG